jgi:hypothetical protein
MKRLLVLALALAAMVVLVAMTAVSAFAGSGPNSPTATHDNPSSCVGAERATRNSNGGDRAQGGFGPAQSEFVQTLDSYGQWLQEWKAANCS